MKAISVQNPWAHFILCGDKTIECRSWNTEYRGDLLICSSGTPQIPGMVSGHALCIVSLDDVTPFRKKHLEAACMDEMPEPHSYAWHLSNLRVVKPVAVKGKLNFYNVDDELIEIIIPNDDSVSEEKRDEIFEKSILPLAYKYMKIGAYYKDVEDGTIVRYRVCQACLEYLKPNTKEWKLTEEGSKYDEAFYGGVEGIMVDISDKEAHAILDSWGIAKPYGE